MGAQSSVPGHSRKPDAPLSCSSIMFLQSPHFDKRAFWELSLAYFINPISYPFPHISQMEVTRNYLQTSTGLEHTFPFPGGSLSCLLTVLPHMTQPKCWFLWGFLLLITSIVVIGLPAHGDHISLSQAAPWWMDGWMGVSSSTSLCISKLACLWVCIRYRWIVANDVDDFFLPGFRCTFLNHICEDTFFPKEL